MGFHQAHNLAKNGYRVIAFDLNKEAVAKLQSLSQSTIFQKLDCF
jgi:UDP-N-acetyl-D-mannosaminuronate dehydrogenase